MTTKIEDLSVEEQTRVYRKAAIRMVMEDGLRLEIQEDAAVELMNGCEGSDNEGGAYVRVEDMFVSNDDLQDSDFEQPAQT